MKFSGVPYFFNSLNLVKKAKVFFNYSSSSSPRFFRRFLHVDGSESRSFRDGLNAYMFREDISLAVVPIGGESRLHEKFDVKINGAEEDVKKAENILLSLDGNESFYRGKRSYCNIVEALARDLVVKGFSRYEITVDDGYHELNYFTQRRFYNIGVILLQIAPKEDARYYRRRLGVGLRRHVWEISMPEVLGGRSGYNKLLKELQMFSGSGPDFWMADVQRMTQENTFDFNCYRKKSKIFHWGKSSIWGWSQRDTLLDDCTEFYLVNRIVRFNKSQAYLREHILRELNLLLRRLGIKAEIVVEGIPIASEIEGVIQGTIDGSLPLSEASQLSRV